MLQVPAGWNSAAQVLARVDEALRNGPPVDLVLLPEACLTGYVSPAFDFDLTPFAELADGPTAVELARLARHHGVTLVGPLIEREGAACFNTTVAFGPAGDLRLSYRKRHPWYPETWATPGDAPMPVVEVHGRWVTVCTCFDVHFVRDEAADVLERADVLLFPSAWVDDTNSREPLLTGLARDFNLAVVNANWGAGAPRVPGQGGSLVVAPGGAVVARGDTFRLDAVLFD